MGGSSSSVSRGKVIPFSENELQLQGIQLGTAEELFSNLLRSSDFFGSLLGQAGGSGIGGLSQRLSETGGLAALATPELSRIIQSGGGATEDQRATLDRILSENISQIQSSTQENLQLLKNELAPGLGLRGGDSPILDRGARIAREGLQQESSARRARGEQELQLGQFNLQRGQFLSNLQQGDFASRLQLGQVAGAGLLGLQGTSNIAQQQESLRPTVAQQTKSSSISVL